MDIKPKPKHRSHSERPPQVINNITVNQPSPKRIGVLERDHTTALVLSIFLGWLGIDQFYLGKTGKGLLKLFTLGLFGILWVIDIIMIATKSVSNIVWKEEDMEESKKSKNWFAKHKALAVIIVIFVIGIIGAATSSNNKSNQTNTANASNNSSSSSKASATSATPKLNQPANDGKFQFTITSFTCGQSQIIQSDDQYETATAQGQFCTMNLNVKNIGSVSQTFDDGAQYIYDSSDKQYNDSSDGTIAANPSSSQFMTLPNVNPGVSISGVLAFDIPKGTTPTYAMLHDSAASDGVKVSLSQ